MAENDYGLAGLPANAPESVKARIMAARLLSQSAAAASAPYTSKGVVGLKAIEGLMGGLQERSAINEAQQGQADQRRMMAQLLLNSASPNAMSAGGSSAAAPAPASPSMIPGSAPTGPANALPSGGDSTRDLAIRTIYGEAGGESDTGKAGVASVLKNRLASGQFGPDMQSVILAPKQFSLWNAGDPAGDNARKLSANSPTYQRIGSIYDGVMSGQTPDPTGGATHYYNPNVASPAWGPKLAAQNDVTIGNHRFVGAGPSGPTGRDPGMVQAAGGPSTAAPGINAALSPGAGNSDPGINANGGAPIGDATVLAARNRLASGTGTDADRATVSTYLQQQNTPAPSRTASADAPAPNAQPVASSSLPPGVTPDMLAPGTPTPSPFGAMPSSMAQPAASPDAATLAAALRGSAGGSGPGATPLPATMQPSSPFGAMPSSMNQAPAAVPGPTMASAPPPSPQPSPFGAGPQPMQGNGGADPAMLAALLQRGAPTPAMGSPALDPSIMQAGGPTAPQAPPLSSNALAMGDLMAGGPGAPALDPSGAALPPVAATGTSSDNLPGMDNFAPDGSVRQSSLGAAGFTGAPADGSMQAAIAGNLGGPQAYVGGPLGLGTGAPDPSAPAPASPPPSVMAAALRQGASPAPMAPPSPDTMGCPGITPPAPAGVDQSAGPSPIAALGATPDGPPPSIADAATAAMAKAGYETTGLPGAPIKASSAGSAGPAILAARNGAPPPTSLGPVDPAQLGPAAQASLLKDAQSGAPLPAMVGANVPPPDLSGLAGSTTPPAGSGLPIMARASSNPPAALQQDFAGLGQPQPQGGAPQASMQASVLPQNGPMPPPRPSNTALGLNPDAPAPNAAVAGPAPASPQMMASLLAQQPMGLPGQGGGDPSSPQAFMRQEAQRAAGGGYTNPTARALAGQTGPAPASPAPTSGQDDGNPLAAIGRLFGQGGGQGQNSGNPLASLPIVGDLFKGGGPGGQTASSPAYGGQGQGQFTPGGQGTPTGQQAQAGAGQGSQATVPGLGMSQQQAIALLSNPYTTPQQAEMIMNRLNPQPMKLSQGEGLVGRRPDGSYGNLYTQAPSADWNYNADSGTITNKATGEQRQVSAAPRVMSPGQQLVGPNGGVQAAIPATPNYEPIPGTGQAMDKTSARTTALPGGAGSTVHTMKVGGVDVPVRITPDPNGGDPKVELMTPGGGQPSAGQPGGPISFNGAPQAGAAPQGGPLGGIAPLVQQAGQMEAANAAAKEGAVGQMKGANTFVEAQAKAGSEAANHVAEMQQLKGLAATAPTGYSADMARYAADHGLVTSTGDAVKSYDGLRSYLGTQLRQAGSGALRNSEMDRLSDALGSTNTSPAARAAAVQRIQDGFSRQAALGQVASDPSLADPMAKQGRIQDLQQTWMNADAAIEAHPDKRAAIIARMQASGVPVVGF